MNDNPAELASLVADASAMYYKRRDALKKLFKADPALARPLLDAVITDKEKVLRRDAAELLGSYRDKGAVALLLKALSDGDSDVKRNAVRSLKASAQPEALEPLRSIAASDPSIFVRREAEEAVKAIESGVLPSTTEASTSTPAAPPWKTGQPSALSSSPTTPAAAPPWKPAPEPRPEPEPRPLSMPSWKQAGLDVQSDSEAPSTPPIRATSEQPPAASSERHMPARTVFDRIKPRQTPDISTRTEPLPAWKKEPHPRPAGPTIVPAIIPASEPAASAASAWSPPRRSGDKPRPEPAPHSVHDASRKVRKAVAVASEPSTLCPKCQWVLKPGQRFCTFCGFALEPAGAKAMSADSRPAERIPVAPIVSRAPRPTQRPAPKQASSGAGCAIAAIVVGAIVVLGIAAAALSSGGSTPAAEPAVSATRTARRVAAENSANAPVKKAAPTAEGRPVVIAMKNGKTIYAFLLSETDGFYRVRVKNGIYNVPKNEVRKVINK